MAILPRLLVILFTLQAVNVGLSSSHAQQPKKFHRIGYLDSSTFSGTVPLLQAFQGKLRELGWIEEKNIFFEYRFAEGKGFRQLQDLAAELVRRKVDIVVTRGTSGAVAAMQATSKIPIVMTSGGDPVGVGVLDSLARPGSNITGVNSRSPELITKRLEILCEVIPNASRLAVLVADGEGGLGPKRQIEELERATRSMKIKLQVLETGRVPVGFEHSFEIASRQRLDAIIPVSGPPFFAERKRIVELADKYRLPAIYPTKEFVETGGLMSYGVDNPDQFRRAALYVDKILRGAKPAELPVEQPTKVEFVINLKAAKQIGVTIPPQVLMDADRVIR